VRAAGSPAPGLMCPLHISRRVMPRAQLTEPMVRPLSRLLPTWWRGPWLTGPANGGFSGSASAHPTDTVSAHSTFPRRSPRLVCATDPAHSTSHEQSSSSVALQCQWPRLLLRVPRTPRVRCLRTPPSQGEARGWCVRQTLRTPPPSSTARVWWRYSANGPVCS
jgi:hypothetical protein